MNNKLSEKPEQSNDKKTGGGRSEPEGFVIIPKIIVEQLADISPGAVKVYIALRSYKKNGGGGDCFPSSPKIIKRSGLSRETVKRALNELERCGFIVRHKSKGVSNRYSFPNSFAGYVAAPPVVPDYPKSFTKIYLSQQQQKYPGFDVESVLVKFLKFCKENNRQPNKRYFESWLKTEDEEMIVEPENIEVFLS
jgi:hypothetical protein